MRGKGITEGEHKKQCRITPAYAGKRDEAFYQTDDIWDHPRLCGEKFSVTPIFPETVGSPPPMRGKATVLVLLSAPKGITPAYAGKRWIH